VQASISTPKSVYASGEIVKVTVTVYYQQLYFIGAPSFIRVSGMTVTDSGFQLLKVDPALTIRVNMLETRVFTVSIIIPDYSYYGNLHLIVYDEA
jgi:hypothetical protein